MAKTVLGIEYRPDKAIELTEDEKWICVVKWLNALYYTFLTQSILEDVICVEKNCPLWETKCKHNWEVAGMPPQMNFSVLERYTGSQSVISRNLGQGL